MKILIVYDSIYGNTELIAQAIAEGFALNEIRLRRINKIKAEDVADAELLVFGSPTHGGRATPACSAFLSKLSPDSLKHKKAAAFDTGIPSEGQKTFVRFVIRIFGYAAKHLARAMEKKGAQIIGSETFFVLEKAGPLKKGEQERAKSWAAQLLKGTKLK